MFEKVLLWLLNRFYPKPAEPIQPAPIPKVAKKTVGRPRKPAVKKPAVVAKTVAKKKVKK